MDVGDSERRISPSFTPSRASDMSTAWTSSLLPSALVPTVVIDVGRDVSGVTVSLDSDSELDWPKRRGAVSEIRDAFVTVMVLSGRVDSGDSMWSMSDLYGAPTSTFAFVCTLGTHFPLRSWYCMRPNESGRMIRSPTLGLWFVSVGPLDTSVMSDDDVDSDGSDGISIRPGSHSANGFTANA